MRLEEIGFYTLSDARAEMASATSPLQRCELILTSKCNFKCPYCRHVGGTNMKFIDAANIVTFWVKEGLHNIRFSGGEPTLYPRLEELVAMSKDLGVKGIAISSNGSASREVYEGLLQAGVNDFSISLDACCVSQGDMMAGVSGAWDKVVENITWLSNRIYVTVGVVLTDSNVDKARDIVEFADSLGVSDIRVIPAAQNGNACGQIEVGQSLLAKYPILRYRINNLREGIPFRGMSEYDSHKCGLMLDDMAVSHGKHYPCIIYMREYGKNIGHMNKHMRADRLLWYYTTDTHKDPICKNNCLDVCRLYNTWFESFHGSF